MTLKELNPIKELNYKQIECRLSCYLEPQKVGIVEGSVGNKFMVDYSQFD